MSMLALPGTTRNVLGDAEHRRFNRMKRQRQPRQDGRQAITIRAAGTLEPYGGRPERLPLLFG